MAHFNDAKYRGPAADLGKSGEGEVKGSGVDGYKHLKDGGSSSDKRTADYRGPAAKLKTE